jgi:hypothetical protein
MPMPEYHDVLLILSLKCKAYIAHDMNVFTSSLMGTGRGVKPGICEHTFGSRTSLSGIAQDSTIRWGG